MANPTAPCFKKDDVVQIIPACFELSGLPIEASGELMVEVYTETWHGRRMLEARDEEGNLYNVFESELRFIR